MYIHKLYILYYAHACTHTYTTTPRIALQDPNHHDMLMLVMDIINPVLAQGHDQDVLYVLTLKNAHTYLWKAILFQALETQKQGSWIGQFLQPLLWSFAAARSLQVELQGVTTDYRHTCMHAVYNCGQIVTSNFKIQTIRIYYIYRDICTVCTALQYIIIIIFL